MAGPIGDVLASGQVVISSVRTLSGMKLSVTVRQGAPKPDISSFDGVKKALLNAKSVAYVDPERGTIGVNAWATVQRLGIVEELHTKTVHGTGGPMRRSLWRRASRRSTSGPSTTMRWCPASSASARSRGRCRHLHQSLARLAFTRGTRREHAHCLSSWGRLKPTRYTEWNSMGDSSLIWCVRASTMADSFWKSWDRRSSKPARRTSNSWSRQRAPTAFAR